MYRGHTAGDLVQEEHSKVCMEQGRVAVLEENVQYL